MPKSARDSRQAIFAAAAAEFAARGFAGAGVDRIARRAGVNKAMIYYHFNGKAHLYREIVSEMFAAIRTRATAVARSRLAPADKIDKYVEAVVAEARLRPHFAPIMMREMAEGVRHLSPDVLRIMLGIFATLRAILAEGEAAHAFRRVDPVVMHFSLVGPIVMYMASTPVRAAVGALPNTGFARSEAAALRRHLTRAGDVDSMADHVKAAARRVLERHSSSPRRPRASRPRLDSRRHAAVTSGEQA